MLSLSPPLPSPLHAQHVFPSPSQPPFLITSCKSMPETANFLHVCSTNHVSQLIVWHLMSPGGRVLGKSIYPGQHSTHINSQRFFVLQEHDHHRSLELRGFTPKSRQLAQSFDSKMKAGPGRKLIPQIFVRCTITSVNIGKSVAKDTIRYDTIRILAKSADQLSCTAGDELLHVGVLTAALHRMRSHPLK